MRLLYKAVQSRLCAVLTASGLELAHRLVTKSGGAVVTVSEKAPMTRMALIVACVWVLWHPQFETEAGLWWKALEFPATQQACVARREELAATHGNMFMCLPVGLHPRDTSPPPPLR